MPEQPHVTIYRSEHDGAWVVEIDTYDFEPDASDGGPGLRVYVNDGAAFEGKAYE